MVERSKSLSSGSSQKMGEGEEGESGEEMRVERVLSAKECYERTVDYVTHPAHLQTVYLRLADIYLREQQVCVVNTTGH